jgi:formate dehydrogenase major subunit
MPLAESRTLQGYLDKHRTRTGWWANLDKYVVSLLKAWYGEAATAGNQFGFEWMPRISGDHSHFGYWLDMADDKGTLEGLFVMGQNPAVGAPNARLERRALANLKWLVVRDMVEVETATFWLDSPEVRRGELKTADIGTEVFLFPAAAHAEKDGCFTNTQRLLQWHEKAVDPPGDQRPDRRDGVARRRVQRSRGRRNDVLRLLDLLRRASRTRSQQGRRAVTIRSIRPWLGIRVAGGPPHPLQPRVGKT